MAFFLPVLLVALAAELLLRAVGEIRPVSQVLKLQERQPEALFMRGIMDQSFYAYKFSAIRARKPNVIALGSSRVMKFTAGMFGSRSNEFYNAGGLIQNLEDLKAFSHSLPAERMPNTIIIGLDLWWFNEGHPAVDGFSKGCDHDAASDWQEHLRSWRELRHNRIFRRVLAALKVKNPHLGLRARLENAGFRLDGSSQDSFPLPVNESEWAFHDRENPPIAQRIRNNASPYYAAPAGISEKRILLLRQTLANLRERKALVIGYLPPFASESALLLQTGDAHDRLWKEFRQRIPELFAEYNLPFVDGSTLSTFGLDDRYMSDGMHPFETFHLHLLKVFLQDGRVSEQFPGMTSHLNQMLNSSKTNPWYPDYSAGQ